MIYGVLWAFGFISGYFIVSDGLPSCIYPPCRYNIHRNPEDMSRIAVHDNSDHSISWSWGVRGGRWNVTYKFAYPSAWYEGTARFSNKSSSNALVSWGYSKNWESNRVRIYGVNAWNISYNGDVFGFIPTGYGKYIFKIFTKNKRHDPFNGDGNNYDNNGNNYDNNNGNNNNGYNNNGNNNGNNNYDNNNNGNNNYDNDNYNERNGNCVLTTTDKNEMSRWWSSKKSSYRNCYECVIHWPWNTNSGRWRVMYKWVPESDRTICSVKYRSFTSAEEMEIINWEVNERSKTVTYRGNPMRIRNENPWRLNLSPSENWGFTPKGNGQWIFQQFSRNLNFRPFNNFRETINIT